MRKTEGTWQKKKILEVDEVTQSSSGFSRKTSTTTNLHKVIWGGRNVRESTKGTESGTKEQVFSKWKIMKIYKMQER